MNDLTHSGFGGDAPQTMSSREIAELTGKRHDNVRVDIEKMAEELSLTLQEKSEPSSGGRPMKVYHLSKRETLILCSGYNLKMRAAIIDRWQELEGRQAPAAIDVRNLPQLQTIALQLIEVNKEQSEQIAVMAPKVEAFDRIANTDGSFCITDAAKTLQMRPKDLFARLREDRWIYTRAGKSDYVAHAPKLDAGLLEHKTTTVSRTDGSEKSVTQVRVTPKGLAKLAAIFSEGAAH